MVNLNNTVFARNLQRRWAEVERKRQKDQQDLQQISQGLMMAQDKKEQDRRYELDKKKVELDELKEFHKAVGDVSAQLGKEAEPQKAPKGARGHRELGRMLGEIKERDRRSKLAHQSDTLDVQRGRLEAMGGGKKASYGPEENMTMSQLLAFRKDAAGWIDAQGDAIIDKTGFNKAESKSEIDKMMDTLRSRAEQRAKDKKAGKPYEPPDYHSNPWQVLMGTELKRTASYLSDKLELANRFKDAVANATTIVEVQRIKKKLGIPIAVNIDDMADMNPMLTLKEKPPGGRTAATTRGPEPVISPEVEAAQKAVDEARTADEKTKALQNLAAVRLRAAKEAKKKAARENQKESEKAARDKASGGKEKSQKMTLLKGKKWSEMTPLEKGIAFRAEQKRRKKAGLKPTTMEYFETKMVMGESADTVEGE